MTIFLYQKYLRRRHWLRCRFPGWRHWLSSCNDEFKIYDGSKLFKVHIPDSRIFYSRQTLSHHRPRLPHEICVIICTVCQLKHSEVLRMYILHFIIQIITNGMPSLLLNLLHKMGHELVYSLQHMDQGTLKIPIHWCPLYWSFLFGVVKLLQKIVYNTTQHPPTPPPHSHTLSVYTVHLVWEGGERG